MAASEKIFVVSRNLTSESEEYANQLKQKLSDDEDMPPPSSPIRRSADKVQLEIFKK